MTIGGVEADVAPLARPVDECVRGLGTGALPDKRTMLAPSNRAAPRTGAGVALAVAVLACSAFAQDAEPPSVTPVQIVVTGTRIPQPNLNTTSPLLELRSADIEAEGSARIEDVINRLPQAFVDQNSTVTNNATGTATVNLRDLGAERTLVLLDGKRLMPGDPTSGSVAPDLNFIPDALVDRVEIVTGGASAVYGSDAIAGVVNFIMKRDFNGLELDAQTGVFDHRNGETGIHDVLAAQGFPEAPNTVVDGLTGEVTVVAGINGPESKSNITVYGGYRNADAINEASRDFSACALTAAGPGYSCLGSTLSPAHGRFLVIDPVTSNLVGDFTLDPAGPGDTLRAFDGNRDAYNFAPFEYFQRPDERYVAGAFAHAEVLPSVDLYADGMVMYDDTVAQLAPSGLFASAPFTIACSNPMLSAAEVQSFCTDAGVAADGSAQIFIGRRDVEAGPRQYLLTHTDYRLVAGARGGVAQWRYDISAQYSAVDITQADLHDVSLTRAADALNVVPSASGALVCASGNPGCAPYDVFKIGGVTQAALAYLDTPGRATGGTDETVVSANLTGSLGQYGIRSPWAEDGAALSLGAEYRQEGLTYSPDAELASGDLASAGFSAPAVSGRLDVYELYGEARLPIVQRARAPIQDVTVDGGYRYSWYSSTGGAATYKAGLEWTPDADLRLRASYNHAVRTPNVVELFTPQSISNIGLDFDPCAGANPIVDGGNPFATEANCARTGVTAAEYGHIAPSPDAYNSLEGGNRNLRPEIADTVTLGAVITPRAMPGFNASVDYFDIKVSGVIGSVDPDLAIEECLQTGNLFLCGLVHRAPGSGSLWVGNDGYVSDLVENSSLLETRGVDVEASYSRDLPTWRGTPLGAATLRLIGTYVLDRTLRTAPGTPSFNCAGYYGADCEDPEPRWRHVLTLTWEASGDVHLSVTWRYVGPVTVSAASSNPLLSMPFPQADYRLGARSYVDLSASWRINRRLEVRAGVNNLFDVAPPVVGTDFQSGIAANANTYPGAYDTLGRWLFVGVTATY